MTSTTETSRHDKLDKVRKLLRLAEQAGTPEEAEAATARAMALAAQHGIDAAVVGAADDHAGDPIEHVTIKFRGTYTYGRARIWGWLAFAMDLASFETGTARRVESVTAYGRRSDLERWQLLAASLELQGQRALASARCPWDADSGAFRRSFWQAFASRAVSRWRELQERARADAGPGVGIVLADRKAAARRALDAEHGEMENERARRLGSRAGVLAGAAAGDAADLGQERVGAGGLLVLEA